MEPINPIIPKKEEKLVKIIFVKVNIVNPTIERNKQMIPAFQII